MKTNLLFVLVLCLSVACGVKQKPKSANAVRPPDGIYGPNPAIAWFAGEVIDITGDDFHYEYFSDCLPGPPPLTGRIKVLEDHIHLDHPNVPNPERIADVLDGKPVLWTKNAYQLWKTTGEIDEIGILYFRSPVDFPHDQGRMILPNQAIQPTRSREPISSSASSAVDSWQARSLRAGG